MIEATKLAPIGSAFIVVVRARWPEFVKYAAVDDSGSLVIEYPSPSRHDGAVLWISADADFDEIIIAFGGGHSHGGPWNEPGASDFDFESSRRFIDEILSEAVVGYTLGSGQGGIGALDQLQAGPSWKNVESIRSWRGTHDR